MQAKSNSVVWFLLPCGRASEVLENQGPRTCFSYARFTGF